MKKIILLLFLFHNVAFADIPLVNTDWVGLNLENENIFFLDVRSKFNFHQKGHIPRSVFTDYVKDGWRVDVKKNGKKIYGVIAEPDHLQKLIRSLGIKNNDHVVVVPTGTTSGSLAVATRIYWTLKNLGHKKISILNGGMKAYINAKLPLEKGSGKKRVSSKYIIKYDNNFIVYKSDIFKSDTDRRAIIDSRVNSQHVGINKSSKVYKYGTIPNSLNFPSNLATINNGGTFRSLESLKNLYEIFDIPKNKDAIFFCNTGHWASLGWFVHSEILGNKGSTLYDGSMSEYTTIPGTKIDRKYDLN